ncbi:hypothetical protein EV421DRAFT_1705030, partial [Armillaria borealis]
GLCLNWGFYFKATVDCFELGSKDIDEALRCLDDQRHFHDVLPSKETPTFGPYLAFNRQYTYHLFSHARLGRLLFFKNFLQSILENPSVDDCQRHWLWAQLQPQKVAKPDENGICQDPLREFMETVLPWPVPNDFFNKAIYQTLGDIFSLWTPDTPFYIVLDEANVITHGTYCFLRAFEGNPILNEILSTMGRFIDKDMQQIVVDEPVCLVAGSWGKIS